MTIHEFGHEVYCRMLAIAKTRHFSDWQGDKAIGAPGIVDIGYPYKLGWDVERTANAMLGLCRPDYQELTRISREEERKDRDNESRRGDNS